MLALLEYDDRCLCIAFGVGGKSIPLNSKHAIVMVIESPQIIVLQPALRLAPGS